MNRYRFLFGLLIWVVGLGILVFMVEDKYVSIGIMLCLLGYHKLTYRNVLR